MKRYSEIIGKEKVNWVKELSVDKLSESDWKRLDDLDSWGSCPVGQQSVVIKRGSDGEPKDEVLRVLGGEFSEALENRDIELSLYYVKLINNHAKIVLGAEEKRILEVVKEFYADSGLKPKK